MKTLKRFAISLFALFAAASMPYPASAEPQKPAEHYYFVGANSDFIGLAPDTVERKNDSASGWIMLYLSSPDKINNQSFQYIWVLMSYDCKAQTAEVLRQELVNRENMIVATIPGKGQRIKSDGQTVGTRAMKIACGLPNDAELFTTEDAESLIGIYAKRIEELDAATVKGAI